MGFDLQFCSIYWLSELVISCNLFCASFHCVLVRCSCWSIFVRFFIARFCFSRKVVCRFWRFLGGIGYIIRRRLMGIVVSFITMLLGASCSWTG